jgi:FkbM family methyltransferase
MKSYSQAKQEEWVIEYFGGKKNGYFLDIGALDGIQSSNTYLLEKQYEWEGLCVEPYYVHLPVLRSTRENVVEMGVYSSNGLFRFSSQTSGINETGGGLFIPTITFRDLIKKYNVPNIIDYISLDVEGAEYEALKEFPFDTHISILWTIEHNLYINNDSTLKNKVKEIMLANNYVISKENVSCPDSKDLPFEDWYIHKDYIK